MAFTKINAAGIGTTETVTVDGLTVINDGSFGGNLTVGGVLTYEDVTNVDSVGLITARNGIVVGSGITLSKDGDVFFTGIATGNGSGLTALNASNLASGTVPTARLGSGTASSSTFLRGDSTFATVTSTTINNNADNRLITGSGTANTLEAESSLTFDGTNLDLGADNKKLRLGGGNDIELYTDGSNSFLLNENGNWYIQGSSGSNGQEILIRPKQGEQSIRAIADGAVELYHNSSKKFFTLSDGVEVTGDLYLMDDDYLKLGNGSDLKIYHNGSHSFIDNDTGTLYLQTPTNISLMTNNNEDAILCQANGAVSLYYDNGLRLQTNSSGISVLNSGGIPALSVSAAGANRADVRILASGTGEAYLWMDAANGDLSGADYSYFQHRNSDLALLLSNYGGDVFINCRGGSLGSGTLDTAFKANAEGSVELYYDGQKKFQTISDGFETGGSFATDGTTSGVRCTAGSLIQTSENSTAFRYAARFYNPNGQVGYISTQNNNTTFNTSSSDRSVKKNFEDWTENTLDLFKNIKPQKFNFINEDDGSEKTKGFIAQEMVDKFPEAYTKGNEEDAKYAFNPSGMVVYLMKALQEATIKIEALETKVAALEG